MRNYQFNIQQQCQQPADQIVGANFFDQRQEIRVPRLAGTSKSGAHHTRMRFNVSYFD